MTTVTGQVTVGGTAYPVSASVTLPTISSPCFFGFWDPASVDWSSGNPVGTWNGAAKFAAAPVKSATYYTPWLGPFPTTLVSVAAQHNASVYLNIEPWNTWGGQPNPTMTDIANGVYDSYLTQLGNSLKATGRTVYVTFAHEMNGSWYPWGIQAVSPALWVTTWKHVVSVIRAAAGPLAQFVWCPNNNDVGPVKPYWPGDAYVDIAGFDGYLNVASTSQTYASFVKPTVNEIRTLTAKPIWNAETGVAGTNRSARISQFAADMRADGLIGFTWFNEGSFTLTTAEMTALTTAVNAWNA